MVFCHQIGEAVTRCVTRSNIDELAVKTGVLRQCHLSPEELTTNGIFYFCAYLCIILAFMADTLTVPGTINLSGILSSVIMLNMTTGALTDPGTVNVSGMAPWTFPENQVARINNNGFLKKSMGKNRNKMVFSDNCTVVYRSEMGSDWCIQDGCIVWSGNAGYLPF